MCEKTKPVCCIQTREREKGWEKEKGTDLSWKIFPVVLSNPLWDLLSTCHLQSNWPPCLHEKSDLQVASGAKNKFAAFPQRDQTWISWEKLLGWNFFPFSRSSRAFGGYHRVFFWRSFMCSLPQLSHFLPTEVSFGCIKNLGLRQNQGHYCTTWCTHITGGCTFLLNAAAVWKLGSLFFLNRTKSRLLLLCSQNKAICVVFVMQAQMCSLGLKCVDAYANCVDETVPLQWKEQPHHSEQPFHSPEGVEQPAASSASLHSHTWAAEGPVDPVSKTLPSSSGHTALRQTNA